MLFVKMKVCEMFSCGSKLLRCSAVREKLRISSVKMKFGGLGGRCNSLRSWAVGSELLKALAVGGKLTTPRALLRGTAP